MNKDFKSINNIVCPIGIYHSNEKPSCYNNFLQDFITEALSLSE